METPKLTDSALNVLRPAAPLLPLDASTKDNVTDCPPSWPSCGPEQKATDPVPALAEPATPIER